MTKIPHVVILGGGFGGLSAATEIRKSLSSAQVKITVIDKKDWFMVGFAKLWILTGTRTFENSIGSLHELEKKEINFIKKEITLIDLQNKNVQALEISIPYDYLLISMGAILAPQNIPGLLENGYNLYDHDQLLEIQNKLKNIDSGKIAISIMGMPYKCPPAPFEASLLIDSMLRKLGKRDSVEIHFYSPALITLPAAGPKVSEQILKLINSEKIIFHNSCKIKSVKPNKMIFENGEDNFDLLLAVPPHVAPDVIYDCKLAKKPDFIPIDRDCKTNFENVYAVGDVTSLIVSKIAIPKAGVFAEGEGLTVAKNIISKILLQNDSALFDGKGGCFIESGKNTASIIKVDMFSKEKPTTDITKATSKNLIKKHEFEKERLKKWFS